MNVAKLYETKNDLLRADDLQGKEISLVIERFEIKEFKEEKKGALYFQGKEKGLILNITNARRLQDQYGDETDGWLGKSVLLYTEKVDFNGKLVNSIKIRFPQETVGAEEVPF